ncbi:MAG TPA: phosphoribosylformylglycinamidine synthase subunit PurQ, partial [Pirellulaceae bacterium]|nr:phosphoribosylformylglycinamidine synthase subunit PurQ [Pirellulaceae bacterium]
MKPRVLILRAPGTNCDRESAFAFERAGATADFVHIQQLLAAPETLRDYQILCLPGGFSYGDDIAAGRILANQIRHHLRDVLEQFKAADKLILGICNGFQILIKSGVLLPDAADGGLAATLTLNDSGKFEDRWVQLAAVPNNNSVFLRGIESMYLPVAHAEGKFVPRDAATLAALQASGQVALTYTRLDGAAGDVPYPDCPNGATAFVAGVSDETGRVFGLMPHPERHIDPTQHPRWTREPQREFGAGWPLFVNA